MKIDSIIFCNAHTDTVKIYLSVKSKVDATVRGSIFSGLPIKAGGTLEIENLVVMPKEQITAHADINNVVSFNLTVL